MKDIIAGLTTQVRQLRRRLKELDMLKADPHEVSAVAEALERLETRLERENERKKQRLEQRKKDESAPKALPTDESEKDVEEAVLDKDTGRTVKIFRPKATPPVVEAPAEQEVAAGIEITPEKLEPADSVTTLSQDDEGEFDEYAKTVKNCENCKIEFSSEKDKFHGVGGIFCADCYDEECARKDGTDSDIEAKPKTPAAKPNRSFKYKGFMVKYVKSDEEAGFPWQVFFEGQYYDAFDFPEDAKDAIDHMKLPISFTEDHFDENGIFLGAAAEKPTVKEMPKESDRTVLAVDTVVEPRHGSPGSKGRVMRHDDANDLVYVMWEEGPLKDKHGFGGYAPTDIKPLQKAATKVAAKPVIKDAPALKSYISSIDLKKKYSISQIFTDLEKIVQPATLNELESILDNISSVGVGHHNAVSGDKLVATLLDFLDAPKDFVDNSYSQGYEFAGDDGLKYMGGNKSKLVKEAASAFKTLEEAIEFLNSADFGVEHIDDGEYSVFSYFDQDGTHFGKSDFDPDKETLMDERQLMSFATKMYNEWQDFRREQMDNPDPMIQEVNKKLGPPDPLTNEVIDELPDLNVKDKRDQLLDQLNKATDPKVKENIKRRLDTLRFALLEKRMRKSGLASGLSRQASDGTAEAIELLKSYGFYVEHPAEDIYCIMEGTHGGSANLIEVADANGLIAFANQKFEENVVHETKRYNTVAASISKSDDKRISVKKTVLDRMAKECPDCYKKFQKFAREKGMKVTVLAEDGSISTDTQIMDQINSIRTRINTVMERMQTPLQASNKTAEVDLPEQATKVFRRLLQQEGVAEVTNYEWRDGKPFFRNGPLDKPTQQEQNAIIKMEGEEGFGNNEVAASKKKTAEEVSPITPEQADKWAWEFLSQFFENEDSHTVTDEMVDNAKSEAVGQWPWDVASTQVQFDSSFAKATERIRSGDWAAIDPSDGDNEDLDLELMSKKANDDVNTDGTPVMDEKGEHPVEMDAVKATIEMLQKDLDMIENSFRDRPEVIQHIEDLETQIEELEAKINNTATPAAEVEQPKVDPVLAGPMSSWKASKQISAKDFQYCPKCDSVMVWSPTEHKFYCSKCDKTPKKAEIDKRRRRQLDNAIAGYGGVQDKLHGPDSAITDSAEEILEWITNNVTPDELTDEEKAYVLRKFSSQEVESVEKVAADPKPQQPAPPGKTWVMDDQGKWMLVSTNKVQELQ